MFTTTIWTIAVILLLGALVFFVRRKLRVEKDLIENPERIWDIGSSLAHEFIDATSGELEFAADRKEAAVAALFLFAKSFKTFLAARRLWSEGFSEDATALARTLYEAALQAQYLAAQPATRGRLFMEFDPVERYRQYKKLKNRGADEVLLLLDSRPAELLALKEEHDRYESNYPRNSWWGDSILGLAEKVGDEQVVTYYTIYWFQSSQVHSGLQAMNSFIGALGPDWLAKIYPDNEREAVTPLTAVKDLIGVIEAGDMVLGLALGDKLTAAGDRVKNTLGL